MLRCHFRHPNPALLALLLALSLFLPAFPLRAQESASAPIPSEESVLADLLRGAARESAAHVTGPALLRIHPDGAHPAVRQIFAEEYSRASIALVAAESEAGVVVTLDVRELKAATAALGEKSYLRTVVVRLGALVEQRYGGAPLWSRELSGSRRDTLAVAPGWEEKDFRVAEPRSWIESLLVPAVAAAAAIVIVVLLFTVRGT